MVGTNCSRYVACSCPWGSEWLRTTHARVTTGASRAGGSGAPGSQWSRDPVLVTWAASPRVRCKRSTPNPGLRVSSWSCDRFPPGVTAASGVQDVRTRRHQSLPRKVGAPGHRPACSNPQNLEFRGCGALPGQLDHRLVLTLGPTRGGAWPGGGWHLPGLLGACAVDRL